jgi:hypothetical protein
VLDQQVCATLGGTGDVGCSQEVREIQEKIELERLAKEMVLVSERQAQEQELLLHW